MLPLLLVLLPLAGACERVSGHSAPPTPFDAAAAMEYTRAQLAFGPRVPGTAGATKAGDWITTMMRARADTVVEQRWMHRTLKGDSIPLRNVLARFNPGATQRILYITHWDTRPMADSDPVAANQTKPIPGANDGAAGVGLFIALGDALRKTKPSVGVDLLFVDGEDYGASFDPPYADVLLGSQYFANHLPTPAYRPMFGILWDMIADANLNILQEAKSLNAAPEVVSRVWQRAADLGYDKYFLARPGQDVTDDHVPFIEKGFHVIDVIDLDYGPLGADGNVTTNYHHTMQDTIDKISRKSLQVVGDVALSLVMDTY